MLRDSYMHPHTIIHKSFALQAQSLVTAKSLYYKSSKVTQQTTKASHIQYLKAITIHLKVLSNTVYCVEDGGGGQSSVFRMQISIDGVVGLQKC